jgi:hypothetical protein
MEQFRVHKEPLEVLISTIFTHRATAAEIEQTLLDQIQIGPFLLNCELLKRNLRANAAALADLLLRELVTEIRHLCVSLKDTYSSPLQRMRQPPSTIEDFAELSSCLNSCDSYAQLAMKEIAKIKARTAGLEAARHMLTNEDSLLLWNTLAWPRRLLFARDSAQRSLPLFIAGFETDLFKQKVRLQDELDQCRQKVTDLSQFGKNQMDEAEYIWDVVSEIQIELRRLQEVLQTVHRRQRILNQQETPYAALSKITKQVRSLYSSVICFTSFYYCFALRWSHLPVYGAAQHIGKKNTSE